MMMGNGIIVCSKCCGLFNTGKLNIEKRRKNHHLSIWKCVNCKALTSIQESFQMNREVEVKR